MLFNSWRFLLFLPSVAIIYFLIPFRWRTYLLLLASYFFYMSWEPAYALLLATSTAVDYAAGLMMSRHATRKGRGKYLGSSLAVNLGLLFTFKYYGFFRSTALSIPSMHGWGLELPVLDALLPVGISFYTFQTLSYTIEVYRGTIRAETNLARFALYVSFFPQLVAGPIERADRLLPQLRKCHTFDYSRVTNGLKLIAWGMFLKVVIADRLAPTVDILYDNPEQFVGPHIVLATFFFAYQIYCDFAGYSYIAIGAAQILGVRLMTNFDRPYFATSIREFWQLWHISLSSWFRDYVYIPLGGNRVGIPRWYLNLLIVFTVSGLWHGANWTFVIWGALHGMYMIIGALTRRPRGWLAAKAGLTRLPMLHRWLNRCVTFCLVGFAWIFFRADSAREAFLIVRRLFSGWDALLLRVWLHGPLGISESLAQLDLPRRHFAAAIGLILVLEAISYFERENKMRSIMAGRPWAIRWAFYVILTLSVLNFGVVERIPFIYFQF